MTEPVLKKIQVTGYTGLQAGVIKSPTDKAYANAGAMLGGEANYKGTFLRGQVEAGTALGAKLELGHTFDIGRNMGLELSAKTQISKSLTGNNNFEASNDFVHAYSVNYNKADGTASLVNIDVPAHSDFSTSWKGGENRTAAAAKLTFGSQKARFGVGIEAGERRGNRPNMAYSIESNSQVAVTIDGKTENFEVYYSAVTVNANQSQFYVTPTASADINLGKNISLNASADLQQAQAGIRWNF